MELTAKILCNSANSPALYNTHRNMPEGNFLTKHHILGVDERAARCQFVASRRQGNTET
ncbi:MAG: hypothetical protein CFH10_01929 [Alphaproteobacteria bacterium MarineAlpha4_Bin2]|nr:MAG: hypothetical protein CFH10_01929 [Alphaproteobacteria bacterium MarineAlpha4_Bin2]